MDEGTAPATACFGGELARYTAARSLGVLAKEAARIVLVAAGVVGVVLACGDGCSSAALSSSPPSGEPSGTNVYEPGGGGVALVRARMVEFVGLMCVRTALISPYRYCTAG